MTRAIQPEDVESFRPLLPIGYAAGVNAYQAAAAELTTADLTTHYTSGLDFFQREFLPQLKRRLTDLTAGEWALDDYVGFAAGSDVDLMTHVVEAVAARQRVALYPGDWFGFRVGCTQEQHIEWSADARGSLACLCIPSVRNGHVTEEMLSFLESADSCLLNLNLFPTLAPNERSAVAAQLKPVLQRSAISISFSRGFGLTASQLGVMLIHRDHPWVQLYQRQWNWFTYFFNAIAAKAFLVFDTAATQAVDRRRQQWVSDWLDERGLPVVDSGSYYVKSFAVDGNVPEFLRPLQRDGIVRLCFKPPQT